MNILPAFLLILLLAVSLGCAQPSSDSPPSKPVADTEPAFTESSANLAARSVNELGLDLLGKLAPPSENSLLSPYSLQTALAMAYAGAAGGTRTEMARVLHYPDDEAALHGSFKALREGLEAMVRASEKQVEREKQWGGNSDPVSLTIANRLFGQKGYAFRERFLSLTEAAYAAPFQPMDFRSRPEPARIEINRWVGEQTRDRIRDLIPAGALDKETRMVLVNAIYLKAAWANEFSERATRPEPFHVKGGKAVSVPTMNQKARFGYRKEADFTALTIPYRGDLQFLVLLPDAVDGLAGLEAKLSGDLLDSLAQLSRSEVILHLPKFKLEPPLMKVGNVLKPLGMMSAFDQPPTSADFDRMAPRRPDDYLYIKDVFHKTFLDLDEHGTEAAAATAISMPMATAIQIDPPKPIEVKVDRPFVFAIQHRSSGTCLFLGRLVDPR